MRNRKEGEPDPGHPIKASYNWEEPLIFCGYDPDEVEERARIVGGKLGVTTEQATQINLLLMDRDGDRIARCEPFWDESGQIVHCTIILNRSLELFRRGSESARQESDTAKPIFANLRSPWEVLHWLLIEELNHAQIDLSIGNIVDLQLLQREFRQDLIEKGYKPDRSANFDLVEVVGSWNVLRLLAELTHQEDRKSYFRQLYQQSFQQQQAVIPVVSDTLAEQVFIPTRSTLSSAR